MIAVQFPPPQFKIRKRGEEQYIFDSLRKRWLLLTEEEWVRQNIIAYFTAVLHFPPEVIAVEKGIMLNGLKKRFDILIYDKDHQPFLMVECKAPDVPLSEEVLQQVLRYNIVLPVKWIVLTNGHSTIAWLKAGNQLLLADQLPFWEQL